MLSLPCERNTRMKSQFNEVPRPHHRALIAMLMTIGAQVDHCSEGGHRLENGVQHSTQ